MMNNDKPNDQSNLNNTDQFTGEQSNQTHFQPKVVQIPVQHVKSPPTSSFGTSPSAFPRIGQSVFREKSPFARKFPDNFENFGLFKDFGFDDNDFNINSEFDDPFFRPRTDLKSRLAHNNKDLENSRWQKDTSPIPVYHNRNSHEKNSESPKRYTTQTTIYPNQNTQPQQQSFSQPDQGIPIKVEHLQPTKSPSTNKSDFKYTESENGTRQPSPPEESKMGSTISNGASKHSKMNTSDFKTEARTTPPAEQPRSEPKPKPQPVTKSAKTPQQKCEEVKSELESIEKEVESFSGVKNDRTYRRLEELLTRCLLKLDEIEKGDDSFNQFRKGLINYANRIGEILDSKGSVENAQTAKNLTETKSAENETADVSKNEQINEKQDSNQTPNAESQLVEN